MGPVHKQPAVNERPLVVLLSCWSVPQLSVKDSWGSVEGLLGDRGRGLKASGAGLRECLPGRRHPCFLTWWSELNSLLVFQGTWIMLSDQEKLTGINAKFVPKGLSSLVDMA